MLAKFIIEILEPIVRRLRDVCSENQFQVVDNRRRDLLKKKTTELVDFLKLSYELGHACRQADIMDRGNNVWILLTDVRDCTRNVRAPLECVRGVYTCYKRCEYAAAGVSRPSSKPLVVVVDSRILLLANPSARPFRTSIQTMLSNYRSHMSQTDK
jgi:hypothetical protein